MHPNSDTLRRPSALPRRPLASALATRTAAPLVLAALAAVPWSLSSLGLAQAAQPLVVRNVTVVSPERSAPLAAVDVVVVDGRIESVGPDAEAPAAAAVIDGRDKFLIPGLTDSHVHTNVLPGIGLLGTARARAFSQQAALYRAQLPRSLLYHGITQVIDPAVGGRVADWPADGPALFGCGAIPVLGGYPMNLLGDGIRDADMPYLVDDPARSGSWPRALPRADHTPEAVVQRIRDDGAICVKLFFENGFGPRDDWPMLSQAATTRIIAEARRVGLPVMAHANATDMQELALAAGVDVMAHGLWNWTDEADDGQAVSPRVRGHLDRLVAKGTAFQPTFRVMESIRGLFDPAALDSPRLSAVVPASLLAWYRTSAAHGFKRQLLEEDFGGMPEARAHAILARPVSRGARVVRYLAQRGHPLLLASDHPATPGHINQPGLSSRQELGHMSDAGVSSAALLAAATLNNARSFGLADRYGVVAPGKVANLLLLGANPLDGVGAYDSIETIILRGTAYPRDAFAAD